jgi:hypothetical protein
MIFLEYMNRSDQSIAMPWQSFDISRVLDVVCKGLAQFIDSGINTVFEVNEGVGGPEILPDLFSSDHFAGALQERRKNLEWPLLKLDLFPVAPQLTAAKISFEISDAEAHGCRG